MARDLAPEQRTLGAHARLEEGVPDAVSERHAPGPRDRVRDRARGADVVQDRLAGVPAQQRLGKQRREEVSVDERAPVVDEEAAVRIAVPRDAEVGAGLEDALDDHAPVLGQERVGLVLGEVPVGRPEGLDQLEVQALEQRPHHRARHAVAAVEHDLQAARRGAHRICVDELEDGRLELLVDLSSLQRSAPLPAVACGGLGVLGFDRATDVLNSFIAR